MVPAVALKNRIVAAIRGALVADAATAGLHWIYDPAELRQAATDPALPEFQDPPQMKFYSANEFPGHYETGMNSPYGELFVHSLQYVADISGRGSAAITAPTASAALLDWVESFGGRPDGALKKFVENMKDGKAWPNCGADDHQAMVYAKVIPVTCLLAGRPELPLQLETLIRVHQNSDKAVQYGLAAARLLEAVLLGASSLEQALATCQENMGAESADAKDAFDRAKKAATTGESLEKVLLDLSHEMYKDQPDSPFYNFAARSCGMPQALIAPLTLFFRHQPPTYVEAVRENILAAGDNCSRSLILGAIIGALMENQEGGTEAPPADWLAKVHAPTVEAVMAAAETIADQAVANTEAATTTDR